jgi:hypothetical protein
MQPTTDWTARALTGDPVWNIGQIDRATVRALDKLAKAGLLVKDRGLWAGLVEKTVWARSGAEVNCFAPRGM